MSVVLHAVILVAIGILWTSTSSGTGGEVDRPIGIAIVHQLPDRDRYVDAQEVVSQTQEDQSESTSSSPQAAAAPPADLSPPIDLAGVLKAMESTPSPIGGTGLAGETEMGEGDFGDGGVTNSDQPGDEASTNVFGISGSGSRFIYVFDRSDSMNGHERRPLRAAKSEMIRSLKTLSERQRFQIIFYNDKAKPFQPSGMGLQMISGEPRNVLMAERYIESVAAFGGTKHAIALKLAMRMNPDVIFFLTDARIPGLTGQELAEIRQRAMQAGTTIHAIEFGPEPVEPVQSFLRVLAAQNGGEYRYIDVRKLGRGPVPARPLAPTQQAVP